MSKQTIKVERYYENGQIKFTGNYQGMPDELKELFSNSENIHFDVDKTYVESIKKGK